MIDRNQTKQELKMRIRFAAGGTTPVSGSLLENTLELLEEDEKKLGARFGKWKEVHGYATPGGTPVFVCAQCEGSQHLHGVEYPKRKMICDNCGCINSYPWEKTYDDESTI